MLSLTLGGTKGEAKRFKKKKRKEKAREKKPQEGGGKDYRINIEEVGGGKLLVRGRK